MIQAKIILISFFPLIVRQTFKKIKNIITTRVAKMDQLGPEDRAGLSCLAGKRLVRTDTIKMRPEKMARKNLA